jgi:hypothetical protein
MRSAVLRAFSIGTVLIMLLASPVGAFEMNGGCTLEIASTDASGGPLDLASGPGAAGGGTQADPFLIDWDGEVSWVGSSADQVFNNHGWQTFVFLVPTPVRGGDPNDDDETVGTGTAGVGENAPFRITGLYYVSGTIDGEGGTHCDGSGWFQLTGNPVTTIPFWVAVLIAVAGAALIWSSRPHAVATTTIQGPAS